MTGPVTRRDALGLIAATGATLAAGPALSAATGAAAGGGATGKMLTRPIPKTGEALPVVGVGTYLTFDVLLSDDSRRQLTRLLNVLFDAGGSVIDSSPMYGRAEEVAGTLLAEMHARKKAFIATKVWADGREAGIAQMRRSLKRFHTDKIDLMQIHNLRDWRTQLKTLRAWKEKGIFRYIGITHFTSGAFEELARIIRAEPLDFLQIPYNIDERDAEEWLLPLARDKGVAVLANIPFGRSSLFGAVRGKALPPWVAEVGIKSWAQYFLKYLLGDPAVTCVIPGTARPQHMADNVKAGFGPMPDAKTRRRMVAYFQQG
jgi:diketogulonate reductase-like aldo/keto reductase